MLTPGGRGEILRTITVRIRRSLSRSLLAGQHPGMSTGTPLTVIVTAHDVGPYIQTCLDSLLASDTDIEVIVVDDASTDDGVAVLGRASALDPRLHVITNETCSGPGPSRNRGLDAARGEHVWFVDGDDWLPDGALDRVVAHVGANGSDVVLFDHVRCYPSGRLAHSSSRPLLSKAPSPPFSLDEWPEASAVLHTPWNKAFRRKFLVDHGIRFSDAPVYEDVSFTYRSLCAAARISVLPEVCYSYRTSRPGALTRRSGSEHLAWADEWRRALEACRNGPPRCRRAVFERMITHGWSVIGLRDGRRIPGRLRRRFMRDFIAIYREERPAHGDRDLFLEIGFWPLTEIRVLTAWMTWPAGRVLARIRSAW